MVTMSCWHKSSKVRGGERKLITFFHRADRRKSHNWTTVSLNTRSECFSLFHSVDFLLSSTKFSCFPSPAFVPLFSTCTVCTSINLPTLLLHFTLLVWHEDPTKSILLILKCTILKGSIPEISLHPRLHISPNLSFLFLILLPPVTLSFPLENVRAASNYSNTQSDISISVRVNICVQWHY